MTEKVTIIETEKPTNYHRIVKKGWDGALSE